MLTEMAERELVEFDWRLAPLYCRDCDRCYCLTHWRPVVVAFDECFYDYTDGTCPEGHTTMLKD